MLQRRIDRRTPYDAGVGRHPGADDLGDLLRFGDGHVRAPYDVDQDPGRSGDVHVQEGGVERIVDGIGSAVIGFVARFSQSYHRHAGALHDGLHIVEVQVDQAGLGDELGDAFDGPHEDLIGHLERGVDAQAGADLQQPVVGDDDDGVGGGAQALQASLRILLPEVALSPERKGGDRNGQGAHVLGELRDVRRRAGAGAAAHAGGDENDVRVGERLAELILGLLGRFLSHLRERSRPQPASGAAAQKDLVLRPHGQKVLRVGIGGI